MSKARQARRIGKNWHKARLAEKTVREDARVLVTRLGALLALKPDVGNEDAAEAVYGSLDWKNADAPSFGFDSDGDLRRLDGHGKCFGPVIAFREGSAVDLVDWPDTINVFAS